MSTLDPSKAPGAPQERYIDKRLREIAEGHLAREKAQRSAASRPRSEKTPAPSSAPAPSQASASASPAASSANAPPVRPAKVAPAKAAPARSAPASRPAPSAVVQKPTRAELLHQLGRPARPIHGSRHVVQSGQFSQLWATQLNSRPGSLMYLWEGYSALEQGAVLDLEVKPGTVTALIDARGVEQVRIEFDAAETERWTRLVERCGESCESWTALLAGCISNRDIEVFYTLSPGLMPSHEQTRTRCSCPAVSPLCLHTATALLALGVWLEAHPLDLCILRKVDNTPLLDRAQCFQGALPRPEFKPLNQELEKLFALETGTA